MDIASDTGVVLLLALLLEGILLAAHYGRTFGSSDLHDRHRLRSARPVACGAARDGQRAKLTGQLRGAGRALSAPLTGRRCLGYRVSLVELRRSEGTRDREVSIAEEVRCVDFLLEEETGAALVQAARGRLFLRPDLDTETERPEDLSPHQQQFLRERWAPGRSGRRLRWRESILVEGASIAVLGIVRWDDGPDPLGRDGYRGATRQLVVYPGRRGGLLVTDEPGLL